MERKLNKVMEKSAFKIVGMVLLIALTVLMFSIVDRLPAIGDPNSAPNTHVSDYYIEEAPELVHSSSLVTAVLADFRGFNTLLETGHMFLAGVAVAMILSDRLKRHWDAEMFRAVRSFGGIEARVAMPVLIPIILVYAVYVLVHSELSLGGGFQAGALMAASFIIYVMFADLGKNRLRITQHFSSCVAACGVLIELLLGMLSLLNGGRFLEYEKLPFGAETASELHATGILLIEIGVTIGVMGTVITILEAVVERNNLNDGSNQSVSR